MGSLETLRQGNRDLNSANNWNEPGNVFSPCASGKECSPANTFILPRATLHKEPAEPCCAWTPGSWKS